MINPERIQEFCRWVEEDGGYTVSRGPGPDDTTIRIRDANLKGNDAVEFLVALNARYINLLRAGTPDEVQRAHYRQGYEDALYFARKRVGEVFDTAQDEVKALSEFGEEDHEGA